MLYAIGSPETYRLLLVDRGWSGAQFDTQRCPNSY